MKCLPAKLIFHPPDQAFSSELTINSLSLPLFTAEVGPVQQGEKWRCLPSRILPEDLWDVNLATCTCRGEA